MDIQLQKGKTNKYCFVSDVSIRGNKKNPSGEFIFRLEFVEAKDGANVPMSEDKIRMDLFAKAWDVMRQDGWHIVDV